MKFKIGDRVKTFIGYGEVVESKKVKKPVPLNLYNIKLDKQVFKTNFAWYAEHELQFEKDVRYLDDYKNKPIKKKKREREISL